MRIDQSRAQIDGAGARHSGRLACNRQLVLGRRGQSQRIVQMVEQPVAQRQHIDQVDVDLGARRLIERAKSAQSREPDGIAQILVVGVGQQIGAFEPRTHQRTFHPVQGEARPIFGVVRQKQRTSCAPAPACFHHLGSTHHHLNHRRRTAAAMPYAKRSTPAQPPRRLGRGHARNLNTA